MNLPNLTDMETDQALINTKGSMSYKYFYFFYTMHKITIFLLSCIHHELEFKLKKKRKLNVIEVSRDNLPIFFGFVILLKIKGLIEI